MNSKRLYAVFFFLAFGVAVVWGSIEFIIYKQESSMATSACEMDLGGTYELAGRELLEKNHDGLWVFNASEETLELRRLGWSGRSPASEVKNTIALRCKTPDYQCFLNDKSQGFSDLHPFLLKNNIGLIEAERQEKKSLVPFQVRAGQLSLSTPLKFCDGLPNADPNRFSILRGKIWYFDSQKSILAFWEVPQFKGLTSQTAPREPDGIYSINEKFGLIPATCKDLSEKAVPAQIVVAQDRLFVVHDRADHRSVLRSYTVGPWGVEPDARWKVEANNAERIWSGDERGILMQSEEGHLHRIWYSATDEKFITIDYPGFYPEPLKQFAVSDGGEIYLNRSGYLLSSKKVSRLREKTQDSFKAFDFHAYKNEEEAFFVYESLSDRKGLLIYPSRQDTRFIPFACR